MYSLLPPILVKSPVNTVFYAGVSCSLFWPLAIVTVTKRPDLADLVWIAMHSS